jgi:hypothetical protein
MPTVSKKQERFMQAVAHNPAFAKKAGVPQSVGKEFTKSGGGMAESKAMMKKEVAFMKKKGAPKAMLKHEMKEAGMKRGSMAKYAEGGMTDKEFDLIKKMYERSGANVGPRKPMSEEMRQRISAEVGKLEKKPRGGGGSGGAASGTREMQLGSELDPKAMMKREGMKYGGKVKKMAAGGMATSKMGAVKTAAPSRDGVATKGKTKGTMVKMAGGGKAKKYC